MGHFKSYGPNHIQWIRRQLEDTEGERQEGRMGIKRLIQVERGDKIEEEVNSHKFFLNSEPRVAFQ